MPKFLPVAPRLLNGLDIGPGCWEWVGARNNQGYGSLSVKGEHRMVHRLMYELFVGPIPEGQVLDHLCRNTSCARPDHLDPCSHRENMLRGVSFVAVHARKTHCPQGHPYSGDNLFYSKGSRMCRACGRKGKAS